MDTLSPENIIRNNFVCISTSKLEEVRIQCPFCNHTKSKCYINFNKGVYHCWHCNSSGTISSLIYKVFNISVSNNVSYIKSNNISKKPLPLPDDYISIEDNPNSYQSKLICEYLFNRQIEYNTILQYKIGYLPSKPNHYVVPIYHFGQLVYYVLLPLSKAYYPYNPSIHGYYTKGDVLFNISNSPIIYITEGILDALSLIQLGFPVVSLLGKSITPTQLSLLSNTEEIVLVLDGDAIDDMHKLGNRLLHKFKSVYICELPVEDDPNSLYIKGTLSMYLQDLHKISHQTKTSNILNRIKRLKNNIR